MKQIISKPNRETIFLLIMVVFAVFALTITYKMSTQETSDIEKYRTSTDYQEPYSDMLLD